MDYINTFEHYHQDLYHYTSIKNLLSILIDGKIKKSQYFGNVSLTRNSNFFIQDRDGNIQSDSKKVKIVLDTEKIKHNIKLKPFNYFKNSYTKHQENDEDEEISKIPISVKYIKNIIISNKYLKKYKNVFFSKEMDSNILNALQSERVDIEKFLDKNNEYYYLFSDYDLLEIIKPLCKKENINLMII